MGNEQVTEESLASDPSIGAHGSYCIVRARQGGVVIQNTPLHKERAFKNIICRPTTAYDFRLAAVTLELLALRQH